MMKAALTAGSTAPLWLLLGVRHTDDILYRAEFEAFARSHPHVRVEFTLSQGGADWPGRRGYVQTHIRELWTELAALGRGDPHVYVCGLERMITAVRHLVRQEMGIARQQVHSERYD
jgi:NAD(P)H-flavin reductase